MILNKRIYENLIWLREIKRASGAETKELDAKIEKLREELQNNPTVRTSKWQ